MGTFVSDSDLIRKTTPPPLAKAMAVSSILRGVDPSRQGHGPGLTGVRSSGPFHVWLVFPRAGTSGRASERASVHATSCVGDSKGHAFA